MKQEDCLKHHIGDDDAECTCTAIQVRDREAFEELKRLSSFERMTVFTRNLAERNRKHQEQRDVKIAEAKEIGLVDRLFILDPCEQVQFYEWRQEHIKTCPLHVEKDGTPVAFPGGASGGMVTWKFTPTGIGMVIIAECGCGEEINLTDYESW